MSRKTVGSTMLAATLAGTLALAGDDLVTVRFGEQDSCKLTGVTTLEYEK